MRTIIAKFDVKPDKVDEFIKSSLEVARQSKKERGNLSYKIFRGKDDSTKFTFIEEWLNDTVIEIHNTSSHFQKFITEIPELINGEPSIEKLDKLPCAFF